jgi:hypothetical protein
MSEWISVEVELPAEDTPVLCWADDGDYCGHEVASHYSSLFTDFTGELLPVTHWMLLPGPPQ